MFDLVYGDYKVCVRHRNHLGITTLNALTFDSLNPTICDFNRIPVYGRNSRVAMSYGINALWGGLAGSEGQVILQGPNNGVNVLFFEVLNAPNNNGFPNFIYEDAYTQTDYDMNGKTIYQGSNTDVNFIFFNILDHPDNTDGQTNFIIYEQKPQG